MKLSLVSAALEVALNANRPAFLWGAPGVGKSDSVHQIADRLGLPMIDYRAIYRDPVDMRGIPCIVNGRTHYNPPDDLPTDGSGILFLDELNAAPQQTQAACYQLVLDRAIGDYKLPDGWRIIAAGNRQGDRGVAHAVPTPLRNRFLHIDVEVDVNDWCAWAVRSGIRIEVIAFVRFRPELLHAFDPMSKDNAFPTPRSWHMVSDLVGAGLQPDIEHEMLAGTVGAGAATEFSGFLRVFRQMPNPDSILLDPLGADVPSEPSARYAITTALARRAEPGNFDRIMAYADRLPQEYAANLVKDATSRDSSLVNTPVFTIWATKNGSIL